MLTMPRIMLFINLLTCGIASCQNATVENYIAKGLENNLALQRQNLSLEQSFEMLKIAKGMFYPTLTFNSDYTYAAGGRNIVLPLGDLLNPAYNSLNQLTGSNNFPNVPNQEFNLSANDYFDNRLHLTLPLVNAGILLNKKIKKEAISQKQAEVIVFKRGLVRDIKLAYYNIVMVNQQIEIFNNADKLLLDNFKITQSRFANGKALKGSVLRIQSDINENHAKRIEAQNRLKTAYAYLNFLTNESLGNHVNIDTTGFKSTEKSLLGAVPNPQDEREEITALKSSLNQASFTVTLRKSAYLPVISTFLDGGYQSTYLKFNTDSRYLLGGVSMKWDIFSGFQNKHKIDMARKDMEILKSKISESANQYEYLRLTAQNELESAVAQLRSNTENIFFLEEYYRETKSRYDQGMVLLLELNDALTQLINARLQYEVSNTTVLVKKAELERNTASYHFNL